MRKISSGGMTGEQKATGHGHRQETGAPSRECDSQGQKSPGAAQTRPNWRTIERQERDRLLIEYCRAGLSAAEIANRFFDCSRNAVIGRVHRLQKVDASIRLGGECPGRKFTSKPVWAEMSAQEKDLAVKERVLAGKTFHVIAKEFGAPSPETVGSVTARLRMRGELPQQDKRAAGAKRGVVAAVEARFSKAEGTLALNIANAARGRESAAGIPAAIAKGFDPIPGIEPVPFGSPGCKWPVDGPYGRGLLACGAGKRPGEAYCRAHSRLAYNPRAKIGGEPAERTAA